MSAVDTMPAQPAAPDADLVARSGRMRPDPSAHLLDFGDRCALFHDRRQELVELNPTAGRIWRGLAAGQTPGAVAAAMGGDAAQDHVAMALRDWLGGGWMAPTGAADGWDQPAMARLDLVILGVAFRVEIFGAPPPAGLVEMLGPLQGEGAAGSRICIVAWRERYLLFVDRSSRGLHAAEDLAPAVKAALTERLAASLRDGFLGHGALVARSGRRIFLSAAPGGGKSTLSLALEKAGFDCHADDIVHVDDRGWVQGAPFAPAVKSGAWPLLAEAAPDLAELPIHRRGDGQQVRYAPAAVSAAPPGPLDLFVVLRRQADGPAELAPLSGLDSLRLLLESAFSPAGRLSAAQAQGLAGALNAVRAYELRYARLDEAVDQLRRLADG